MAQATSSGTPSAVGTPNTSPQGATPATAADEVVKLAYDAAVKHLAQQDLSLGNLRNRATWLLTAAGILISLATSVGLLNTDPTKGPIAPEWLKFWLLGIMAAMGLAVLFVVWPVKDWDYGPAAAGLLSDRGQDETFVREQATESLCEAIRDNGDRLYDRARVLSAGYLLLVAQIVLILVGQVLA